MTTQPQFTLLGRMQALDPRDADYAIQRTAPEDEIGRAALDRGYRYWWQDGWWGDQWYTPQCVSYAWLHWLEDGPTTHLPRTPNRESVFGQGAAMLDPANLYREFQLNDEWAGTDYDGTSVRAGAKVLQRLGLIGTYRWAWDIDTVVHTILTKGPVVVGTSWMAGMSNPDEHGIVSLTGEYQGGHAYELNGVNMSRGRSGLLRIKNSWGRAHYGIGGNAWIEVDDFARLLDEHGEVCLADELELAA